MSGAAILGSTSSHNGVMISASGTHFTSPQGSICVNRDNHSCPIVGHGITPVTGNSTKTTIGGKPAILNGAMAGCGAVITGNFAANVSLL